MTDVIAKTQSVDALQRQFNDLNDTLKRNAEDFHGSARDITSNSDAAIANRDAIRQMATAILDMHDKEIGATGDIKGANKAMADQVVQLEQVATNAGLSKDQVDTPAEEVRADPPGAGHQVQDRLDVAGQRPGQDQRHRGQDRRRLPHEAHPHVRRRRLGHRHPRLRRPGDRARRGVRPVPRHARRTSPDRPAGAVDAGRTARRGAASDGRRRRRTGRRRSSCRSPCRARFCPPRPRCSRP